MKTILAIALFGTVATSLVGCAHKPAAKTDQPTATQPTTPAPMTPSSEPENRPPPN